MKTLKESLFDKDLVQKSAELTFGDVYGLLPDGEDGGGRNNIEAMGFPIGQMFDPVKLMHYENKYDGNDGNSIIGAITPQLAALLGIIMNMSAPFEKDLGDYDSKWGKNLKKILLKYIKRSWKDEFNKKLDIYLRKYIYRKTKLVAVWFNFDNYGGSLVFTFKQK